MVSPGIVLWHVTMSLDGFIAGPDDAMDWIFEYKDPIPELDEVIQSLGAALTGRRGYEVGRQRGWKLYGGAWTGPTFVLTHEVPDVDFDPSVTFSDDVGHAVVQARAAAGGKNVLVIGAETARSCLRAGLIDEVLVHIVPVLLGAGVRLFSAGGSGPIKLEKVGLTEAGQITTLRLRVPKPA